GRHHLRRPGAGAADPGHPRPVGRAAMGARLPGGRPAAGGAGRGLPGLRGAGRPPCRPAGIADPRGRADHQLRAGLPGLRRAGADRGDGAPRRLRHRVARRPRVLRVDRGGVLRPGQLHADGSPPDPRRPDGGAYRPCRAAGRHPRPDRPPPPRATARGAGLGDPLRHPRRRLRSEAGVGPGRAARGDVGVGAAPPIGRRGRRRHARRRAGLEPPSPRRPVPGARRSAAEGGRPAAALPAGRRPARARGGGGWGERGRTRPAVWLLRPGPPDPRLPPVRRRDPGRVPAPPRGTDRRRAGHRPAGRGGHPDTGPICPRRGL
ncbi:MAG: Transcriptional regulator, AraC family, partial [uncultured Thermomicrobiales bacterium]